MDLKLDLEPNDNPYEHESGAKRSERSTFRFDLIPADALRRLAFRYNVGVDKYGADNWKKGLPVSDTFNHVIDHLFHALDGTKPSEGDHLAAAAWGIFALIYEEEMHQEELYTIHNAQKHGLSLTSKERPIGDNQDSGEERSQADTDDPVGNDRSSLPAFGSSRAYQRIRRRLFSLDGDDGRERP